MLPLGAHHGARRTVLVLLQLLVFVTYIFGPTSTFAEDPSPDPSPTETSAPEPSTEPEPTVAPEPSAEPTAPPDPSDPPAPSSDPDPTPQPSTPEPSVEPTAEPEPSAEPSSAPSANTVSYVITYAAGTSEARQLEIIADAGATDVSSIPQLTMRSILLSESTYADQLAALRANADVARVDLDRTREVGAEPSDLAFPEQWALSQVGWTDLFGTVSIGGTSTVAVLDTGVDASHPDLDGVVLSGTSVLDGGNGRSDPNGHGTWMAGIVAAETDNGIGVAGTAYAGVSILPVTVLDADGLGQDSDIIAGVVYAADAGADVILMSFSNPGYSSALQAAIDYAWASGAVLVAAAGNDGSTTNSFPAGDRGVIGVASTDTTDALAASSNSGASVFLAAPGEGIATTSLAGTLATISGTSASAALVAGAAALLRANEPGLANGVVVNRLAATADLLNGATVGNGRLNLLRAMADGSLDAIQPAGSAPIGDGGPLVGPYVLAANNDADIAPAYHPGTPVTVPATSPASVTFSTLYEATGDPIGSIRITLPSGTVPVSIAGHASSTGTLNAPTISGQIVSATTSGGIVPIGGWVRIDITATVPASSTASWDLHTWTAANFTGPNNEQQGDQPAVLIGLPNPATATSTFVNGAGVPTVPILKPGVSATLTLKITQTGGGNNDLKYTAIALPTCFSQPTLASVSHVVRNSTGGVVTGYTTTEVIDNFIRLANGQVPLNGSNTITFTTTPSVSCAAAVLTFPVSISSNQTNPASTNNQIVTIFPGPQAGAAIGNADLSITKTDSPDPVLVSSALQYTLSVANAGPAAATAITVSDPLPTGTTFLSTTGTGAGWTCVTPAIGGTGTVSCTRASLAPSTTAPNIVINVTSPAVSGTISNTATVSSPHDDTPSNNSDTVETTVVNEADVSVTKNDGVASVTAGSPTDHTYTITVSNAGPGDATGVTLSDTWPTGFTRGTVTPPGDDTCDTTTSTTDFTCDLGTIEAGENKVVTVSYTVPADTTASPQVNSVSVGSELPDPDESNNTATDSNTVATSADLWITKSDSADPVTAGEYLTYTIMVSNAGPSDAAGVDLTDVLPDELSNATFCEGALCDAAAGDAWTGSLDLGTIPSGGSTTVRIRAQVDSDTPAGEDVISNTASVASDTDDPDETNNSATALTDVDTSADVSIVKSGPATVIAGQSITYTLTVHNDGPSDAQAVLVSDALPAELTGELFCTYSAPDTDCDAEDAWTGSTTLATLAADATIKIKITADVPANVADGTELSNFATADSTTDDDDETNNTSNTVVTEVQTLADLKVSKTATATASGGDQLTYTVSVENLGPSDNAGFTVVDALPAGTTFVSASSGCVHSAGTVTCTSAGLAAGSTVTWTITVATTYPMAPGTLTNTATIGTNETDDDNAANDSASASTQIVPRRIDSTSTMTNSAFQLKEDLGPWTITDFEILMNNKNVINATNPGQFYYHQRAVNTFPGPTTFEFRLNWPADFETQTTGGQPLHVYVRLATDSPDTWRDWSSNLTNRCATQTQNACSGADGTVNVHNVPAGATVWVTAHLDYGKKGDTVASTFTQRPILYGPFQSDIVIRDQATGILVGESSSNTSIWGRGKKVTFVYGQLTDRNTGDELANTWVRVEQGSNWAVAKTDSLGDYVLFDGQACTVTGGLEGGCNTAVWNFANGTVTVKIRIMGDGAAPSVGASYPTGYGTAGIFSAGKQLGATLTAPTAPEHTVAVAKNSAYQRDWRFTPPPVI